jgi:hypothetical protein
MVYDYRHIAAFTLLRTNTYSLALFWAPLDFPENPTRFVLPGGTAEDGR